MITREMKAQLIKEAEHAAQSAYAPYSRFRVGTALLTEKGNIYKGCNIENASYSLTCCAERVAIFAAVLEEGPAMRISMLVIETVQQVTYPPCGACRQVISEFATSKTRILYRNENSWTEKNFSYFLPETFSF